MLGHQRTISKRILHKLHSIQKKKYTNCLLSKKKFCGFKQTKWVHQRVWNNIQIETDASSNIKNPFA